MATGTVGVLYFFDTTPMFRWASVKAKRGGLIIEVCLVYTSTQRVNTYKISWAWVKHKHYQGNNYNVGLSTQSSINICVHCAACSTHLSTGPVDLVLQDVAGCKLVQESVGDEESHERLAEMELVTATSILHSLVPTCFIRRGYEAMLKDGSHLTWKVQFLNSRYKVLMEWRHRSASYMTLRSKKLPRSMKRLS